jgi:uncharacterized protein (DUF1330 family)
MAAYFIVELDVQDAAMFEQYRARVPATIERYGGRYETLEGEWRPARIVLLEFPSMAEARRWYDSDEYRPFRAQRLAAARGERGPRGGGLGT